jgi:hypothetical protein
MVNEVIDWNSPTRGIYQCGAPTSTGVGVLSAALASILATASGVTSRKATPRCALGYLYQ